MTSNGVVARQTTMDRLELERLDPAGAFSDPNFDAKAFVSDRLRLEEGNTADAEVRVLTKGLAGIEEKLRTEISTKTESLLASLSCVDDLHSLISSLKEDLKEIESKMKQVTAKVREPQLVLRQQSTQLRSLRSAIALVISTTNYLKLVKKLKKSMQATKEGDGSKLGELAKAAKLLREMRNLQQEDGSLDKVNVVRSHAAWVRETWEAVSLSARDALHCRVSEANYGDVGLAFQVYFNLGELEQVVERTLLQHSETIAKSLEVALTNPAGSKGGQGRSGLLGNFGVFLNDVLACMLDVWQIQRVLSSKFDPATNTSFLEVCSSSKKKGDVDQPYALTTNLWHSTCSTLSSRLGTAFYKSISLKNELVSHYPDLAQTLRSFVRLLQKETSHTNGVLSALPNYKSAGNQLLRSVEAYQTAFKAKSLNRMIEAVNILFSPSSRSLPTSSDMKRSIKCFFTEIQRCETDDGDLIPACITNVAKAVRLMKERAEKLVASGPEVKKVSGACTNQQQRNIALCCRIQEVYTTLGLLLAKIDDSEANDALSNALEALKDVSSEAVAPLFRSMLEMLEGSIVHVQEENFAKRGDGSSDMSVYLSDLLMKISHCRTEYLAKFKIESSSRSIANEMVNGMIKKLASRVLEFYLRHAALVRNLDGPGRKCLANDMKQIQGSIEKALCPLEALDALGGSQRSFQSFVTILLTETDDLRRQEEELSSVPPVDLVHHLFSRMPDSLQSPQEASGLPTAKYVIWMEQHSTQEILQAAGEAIESYESKTEVGLPNACSLALETIKGQKIK
ncbi:putative subunit 5 of oligomeric Golgi complex [Chloropicon primus]|uniref:Conserved oligomeric Golgi complex subunit 5 n=1 Tax=Chloropicon primus TaxID=1764295 RepID=A0A5B8MFT8_9CHLO|nr:putative subunit 5 of oligomeric Golgi complex [Chloropicon primus]UPQ98273.1 putative subunit 5 of oligomeric Golgi complex [Chloropicon primus]|eukprot:QDZ19064.1 putative subunit 5 of oligomeric Golgi complex [Chloropicon primus]